MNLYFRLLRVLWLSLWQKRVHPQADVETSFRVWPQDLDIFCHMNNGRYLQIMDVARVHWLRSTRVLDKIVELRCGAVLGGSVVRYCKPLRLFARYVVRTRVLAWESRWVFVEHRFENRSGELAAIGYTRAAMRNAAGWLDPQQLADAVAPGLRSPEIPAVLRNWLEVDDGLVGRQTFAHLTEPKPAS